MMQKRQNYLYVALDIQESDPGFAIVFPAIGALGQALKIGASFWQIKSIYTAEEAFKQINSSMLDRRIDSNATLMLLDPSSGQARWHLRQPLSDLIESYWAYQNNLFVSFSLQKGNENRRSFFDHMTRLGMWAPVSKSIWYISTAYTAKDAFHYLIGSLEDGDRLALLNSQGDIAFWQEGARIDKTVSRVDRNPVSIQGDRSLLAQSSTSFK